MIHRSSHPDSASLSSPWHRCTSIRGPGPGPAADHAERHLKSTEVAADHKVTFRIYAPKAERGLRLRRLRPGRQDDEGRPGRLVDHRRPADARLLQLHVQRRRRPHRRPEERDDQAGRSTAWTACSSCRARRPSSRRRRTCRTARSAPSGIARARSACRAGCTSTRRRATRAAREKYPVLYLLHGGGDEDSGWSTIGRAGFILDNLIAAEEGGADARGDAQRQPAAPGEPAPVHARHARRRPRSGPRGRPPRAGSPTSCSRRSSRSSRRPTA